MRTSGKSNRVGWLLGCLAVLLFVGFVMVRTARPEPRTLFLHPDGMLSLGDRNSEKFPPGRLPNWSAPDFLPAYDHIVLDAPQGTPLSAWNHTLEPLVSAGFGCFQLKMGSERLNFHIPLLDGNLHLTADGNPLLIDLRTDSSSPYQQKASNPDVVILIDPATTHGQLFDAARPHLKEGLSLVAESDPASIMIIRRRDEDAIHRPPKINLMNRIRIAFDFR